MSKIEVLEQKLMDKAIKQAKKVEKVVEKKLNVDGDNVDLTCGLGELVLTEIYQEK